jgi:hypothetical protein
MRTVQKLSQTAHVVLAYDYVCPAPDKFLSISIIWNCVFASVCVCVCMWVCATNELHRIVFNSS